MGNLVRRIERLEEKHNPNDDLTVFLISWLGDGPITRATFGGNELRRSDDETKEKFESRASAWAKSMDGPNPVRVIWLKRDEGEAEEYRR